MSNSTTITPIARLLGNSSHCPDDLDFSIKVRCGAFTCSKCWEDALKQLIEK